MRINIAIKSSGDINGAIETIYNSFTEEQKTEWEADCKKDIAKLIQDKIYSTKSNVNIEIIITVD